MLKLSQDKATVAIDIFDELIESEVAIVVPHIKPMVELCLKLSAEKSIDDALRIKVFNFCGCVITLDDLNSCALNFIMNQSVLIDKNKF